MIDPKQFEQTKLIGGFTIIRIELDAELLTDALGREAIARTSIIGKNFELTIRPGLSEKEESVTLYHEVLEAAAMASDDPPESVLEFNKGDFEAAAYTAHDRFGLATPNNLNRMLQSYGFREP